MRRRWILSLLMGSLATFTGCTKQYSILPPNMHLGPEYQAYTPNQTQPTPTEAPNKNKAPQTSTCIAFGDWMITAGNNARNNAHKAMTEEQRRQCLDQSARCYENAKQLYQQALQQDPKEMRAYLGLAKVAQEEGQYALANEHYQRVLKEYPNDASIWFEYGLCLAKQKNWNESLECMQKATKLDAKNSNYTSQYAWALSRVGRYEESWTIFRSIYGDGPAYFRVAQMAMHLGQYDKSRHFVQLSLQIEPNNVQAQELLTHLNNPENQSNASSIQQTQFIAPPK